MQLLQMASEPLYQNQLRTKHEWIMFDPGICFHQFALATTTKRINYEQLSTPDCTMTHTGDTGQLRHFHSIGNEFQFYGLGLRCTSVCRLSGSLVTLLTEIFKIYCHWIWLCDPYRSCWKVKRMTCFANSCLELIEQENPLHRQRK